MLFSSNGPHTISDERVISVYRDIAMGRYCQCTLVLDNGEEVAGLASVAALDALEARLNGHRSRYLRWRWTAGSYGAKRARKTIRA